METQEAHKAEIETLLEKVKLVFGYSMDHSKDCDIIAGEISKKTGEQISGSTIKRLYGFIKATSSANKYTLNLLARYCGYSDYKSFQKEFEPQKNVSTVNEITNESLINIKTRSGIEPKFWIENKTSIERLTAFYKSKNKATAVIGEGGSGKSVLSATFAEEVQNSGKRVLFIQAASLNRRKGNYTVTEWVATFKEKIDLLIVDSIEETAYNLQELKSFFAEFIDFLKTEKNKTKLIITVRPFTWIKLREIIDTSNSYKDWVDVDLVSFDPIKVSNIPPLDEQKVKELLPKNTNEALIDLLKKPIFFQLFMQSDKMRISNDWDLLNNFFKTKVWSTAHAFEKNQFFLQILESTNQGKEAGQVNRKVIESLIVRYKKPHLDLLSFNILCEEKEVNRFGVLSSFFRFGHELYFDFIILSNLLQKHNGYKQALVEEIANDYPDERKLSLLKLSLSFALSEKNHKVANFFNLNLSEFERQSIMIHLAHQIRVSVSLQQEILPLFLKVESGRTYFIERWIDEANLNGFYGDLIKKYLTVVKSPQDRLFGNALLYYKSYLNKDAIACTKFYDQVKKIAIKNEHIHPFVLGRKYMTLLLEANRKEGKCDKKYLKEIELILRTKQKESVTDLPVCFAPFEFCILHAEFLTGCYSFTKDIIFEIEKRKKKLLHSRDYDLILYELFKLAYYKRVGNKKVTLNFSEQEIEYVFPWYRYTVRNYIKRLES